MSAVVVTKGLVKSFGRVKALRKLNLEARGDVSGFIGPNGAGKTTTIHILLGLLRPDFGEAYVLGFDCWRESFEVRRRVGVLHEKPNYPGCFTGLRYIEHVSYLYGISKPKQRAWEVLKDVGLADVADRAIKTYSAGMVQRLGLAQALVGEPELVMLDEPTANLDPLGRMEILDKIKLLSKDLNVKFLISTHILPELEKVCDWVSIIDDGVIADQGYFNDLAVKHSCGVYKIVVSNPSYFASALQDLNFVERLWVEGDAVYIRARGPPSYNELLQTALSLKVELKELRPLYNTLEDVFKKVVRRPVDERQAP